MKQNGKPGWIKNGSVEVQRSALDMLAQRMARMVVLLRAMEWCFTDEDGIDCCPVCGNGKPDHGEGCELKELITPPKLEEPPKNRIISLE